MTTDIPDWIAFARAAEWLAIPVDVLTLKDEPVAHIGATASETLFEA